MKVLWWFPVPSAIGWKEDTFQDVFRLARKRKYMGYAEQSREYLGIVLF